MKLYSLLLALGLNACGATSQSSPFATNAELEALAVPFYEMFPDAPRNSILVWTRSNEGIFDNARVLAVCTHSEPPLVELHAGRIYALNTAKVQVILWHELAHCALKLPHYDEHYDILNTKFTDSMPKDRFDLLEALKLRLQ